MYVHSGLKTLTSTRIDLKDLIGAGKIPTTVRNAKNIETVASQDKVNGESYLKTNFRIEYIYDFLN